MNLYRIGAKLVPFENFLFFLWSSNDLFQKGALDTLKQHNPLVKTVKQQLKEELRTAISERKRLLELRNRSDLSKTDKLALAFATAQPSLASSLMKGRSETDLKALTSGYLDPNTATNVSNLLNAQSNDHSFLTSRSSFLVDDVALRTDANSSNAVGGVRGAAESINRDVSNKYTRFKTNDYKTTDYQTNDGKLRGQKSLDSYLNDPYLERLKSSLSAKNFDQPIGQTMTTTTFINSPINMSNYASTFSNPYLKSRLDSRLETGLSGRLEIKETTIQEADDRKLCRSSMSQSFGMRSSFPHSRLKPSLSTEYRFQDGLLDRELLGLDFNTSKCGELDARAGLLPTYENYDRITASNENPDGKTVSSNFLYFISSLCCLTFLFLVVHTPDCLHLFVFSVKFSVTLSPAQLLTDRFDRVNYR